MAFHSILCPVDFSPPSHTALRYAATLAATSKAQLTVLYVDDPLLSTAAAVTYGTGAADKEEVELKKFVKKSLADTGLSEDEVRYRKGMGKPAPEILEAARQLGADLVVMGTSGATGAARIVLGSTTETVLRKSDIPILAVPPTAQRLLRGFS